MEVIVTIAVVAVCTGLIIWRVRRRKMNRMSLPSQDLSLKDLAQKAFVHGNTCLVEGKFAEATAAFHQTLELDPTHPHAAEQLAEVDRQQAANARDPANTMD